MEQTIQELKQINAQLAELTRTQIKATEQVLDLLAELVRRIER